MRALLVGLLLLPLLAGNAAVQAGDPQAGKTLWEEDPAIQCSNCHGAKGEGAFGPDLAGRKLTVTQFTRAVREPWGAGMPAWVESQLSDREIRDIVAYLDSLPSLERPGPWRVEVPAGAPRGQELLVATVGCAQCHGVILNTPRADMGAVGADFEWFKNQVYNHAVAMPEHWKQIEEAPFPFGRVRMGNYFRTRLHESTLREIYDWARDVGYRAALYVPLSAGVAGSAGVTYTLDVENYGLPGKGLTAEDLTVSLVVPVGANVVATTGPGYQGVRSDAVLKGNVAVWELPRLGPKEKQTFTLTLSRAGTATDNVRGRVVWRKPVVKTGPYDSWPIALAPLDPAASRIRRY